jgi:hypothetical protein
VDRLIVGLIVLDIFFGLCLLFLMWVKGQYQAKVDALAAALRQREKVKHDLEREIGELRIGLAHAETALAQLQRRQRMVTRLDRLSSRCNRNRSKPSIRPD